MALSGVRTTNDKNSVDDKNAFKDFTIDVEQGGKWKVIYQGQGELVRTPFDQLGLEKMSESQTRRGTRKV